MDAMITEILDAALFHAGDRPKLDLTAFDVAALATDIRYEFETIHGPRIQQTGCSAFGYWDRGALQRVIENLLSNAVKYGAPETPIRLDTRSEHGRMILTVHNEGKSIPREEMECIFHVFQRATAAKESDKQGWGVGLPYIRNVAESHGGSVVADSGPERGTTFGIDIPVDSRPFQNAPVLGSPGR